MKCLQFLLIGALALLFNACEMHPASELAGEEGGGGAAGVKPATEVKPEEKKDEGKPGEAPKFFPEKK